MKAQDYLEKQNTLIMVKMEEYKALRSEILKSMDNRNKIMIFGLATIMVVFNAGIRALSSEVPIIPYTIFCALLPFVSLFVLSLWFYEVTRMGRAGLYLMSFERKIDELTKHSGLLYWERYLRGIKIKNYDYPLSLQNSKSSHRLFTYVISFVLFIFISVVSFFLSLLFLYPNEPPAFWIALFAFTLNGTYVVFVSYEFNRYVKMVRNNKLLNDKKEFKKEGCL